MLKDHPPCPKCGSRNVAQILYGLVQMREDVIEKLNEKEITLGGCCVDADSPSWECNECHHQWGNWADDDKDSSDGEQKEGIL